MKKLTEVMLIGALIVGASANVVNAASNTPANDNQFLLKTMDCNQDNMVSKDEFLAYSEKAFNKMKLTNGKIHLKSKAKNEYQFLDADSSTVRKIGTTADNPVIYASDAVLVKTY